MKRPTIASTFLAVPSYAAIGAIVGAAAGAASPRIGMFFTVLMFLVMLLGAFPKGDPRNLLLALPFFILFSIMVDFVVYVNEGARFRSPSACLACSISLPFRTVRRRGERWPGWSLCLPGEGPFTKRCISFRFARRLRSPT